MDILNGGLQGYLRLHKRKQVKLHYMVKYFHKHFRQQYNTLCSVYTFF